MLAGLYHFDSVLHVLSWLRTPSPARGTSIRKGFHADATQKCSLKKSLLRIITIRVGGVLVFSVQSVCVSVCLSCLGSNFWTPWPTNFIFGMQMQLRNMLVKVEYQGNGVKVKVIQAKLNTHIRTPLSFLSSLHTLVVCLRLKGNFLLFLHR